jgi:transposase-like protein
MKETPLPKTLQEAVKSFADDQFCIDLIAAMRWADGQAVCPKCGEKNNHFMASRKVWQCKNKECKKQFSVKVGTIFEDSALGLDKWLMAMWLLVNAKNGISSYELHRALGITQKSAWFVLHRIRDAMTVGSIEKLSGTIETDETFIGGDAKNMHLTKRKRFEDRWTRQVKGHKTAVFGMVQRGGQVRAQVIKKVRAETVLPIIRENVEKNSEVFTDRASIYRQLWIDYVHASVDHATEYVRDNVHTNSIENFWSLLKRTIKGTYISVSPAHLQKYVEEQMFRYNEREGNDQTRFLHLIELISGKRLTYVQLIGYEGQC